MPPVRPGGHGRVRGRRSPRPRPPFVTTWHYERRGLIVTSNKPFSAWGEIFGDDTAVALVDRLIHHAEFISLKGDSYRLKHRDLVRMTPVET